MINKKLLIASVFGPSERNRLWYNLQRRFIATHTDTTYDYKVFLNGVPPDEFDPSHIAHVNQRNIGHSEALQQVLAFFRHNPYSSYLILDSDSFPILSGWHAILTGNMKRFGKTFAAPVRCENLDLFPHPCAFFMLDTALEDRRLSFEKKTARNLLGAEICDVGAGLLCMQSALLPLLRSNAVNLHPVAAAIYNGIFYHHGAGSRGFTFRVSERFSYNNHWWPPASDRDIASTLVKQLEADPEGFLSQLKGG